MLYRLLFLIPYMLLGGLACWGAFIFRFYFDPLPNVYGEMLKSLLPWAFLLKGLAAELGGLTRAIWRYASFRDLRSVLLTTVLGSLFFIPMTHGMQRIRMRCSRIWHGWRHSWLPAILRECVPGSFRKPEVKKSRSSIKRES